MSIPQLSKDTSGFPVSQSVSPSTEEGFSWKALLVSRWKSNDFGDWNLGQDPFKPEANYIFLTPRVFSMGAADGCFLHSSETSKRYPKLLLGEEYVAQSHSTVVFFGAHQT